MKVKDAKMTMTKGPLNSLNKIKFDKRSLHLKQNPAKFETEQPSEKTLMQSLMWLIPSYLFTSDFPGAALLPHDD
jgi:hypothetical protein